MRRSSSELQLRNLVEFLEVKLLKVQGHPKTEDQAVSHFHGSPHLAFSDCSKVPVKCFYQFMAKWLLFHLSKFWLWLWIHLFSRFQYSVFPWNLHFLMGPRKVIDSHFVQLFLTVMGVTSKLFTPCCWNWKCLISFKSVNLVLLSSFQISIAIVLFFLCRKLSFLTYIFKTPFTHILMGFGEEIEVNENV